METKDVIDLPPSSNSGSESRNGEIQNCSFEPSAAADSQQSNLEDDENMLDGEIPGSGEADVGNGEGQLLPEKDTEQDLIGSSSILEISAEMKESFSVAEDIDGLSSRLQAENGCVNVQDGSPIGRQKRDESPVSTSVSGVKKARIMVNEQQPSVHVTFNFLTRNSKRKLEELLQHWSEWHAQHCSLSHDSSEVLESGEETYFPALRFSLNNSSAVSFWMDNKPRNHDNKEIIPSDSYSIPLYDRGYLWALTSTNSSSNLEGGLEMVDSSRCFNCGAYNHTLKECPKPRDNVAVNNARKQHQSKRNQNASSRNPTRYYQNSAGGKYDGLRPGVLDAETQALLGLGELDPPPWLNRMREIGYPPGYLDPDDEEQPSGITIFGDEERKEETEDGEILDTDYPDAPRKMSVQFPGINAPIPENADERRWSAGPSSSEFSRNRLHNRVNHSSQTTHHDQRWSRDYRDQGPPGCDPRFNPTLSRYSSRYDDYDFSCSSWRERGNFPIPMSPSLERSSSDRGRWSPSVHDDSPKPGSYNFSPYSPPNRLFSSPSYGSGSSHKWDDDSRYEDPYYSSHHRDRDDKHRHHRRR